ncbi:MAG: adenylate/guanylate cyclase domain-containing protein [Ahrensia sp.]|nr:adenylate/guanylate cyclase domain-containing protein [Ahrensia sp.]
MASAVAVWILALWPTDPLQRLDTLVFDAYQQIKPREWAGSAVKIVDIDETSIKRLGQWPWPRTTIAELTQTIGDAGAATITFDMIFSESDRTSPVKTIETLRERGLDIEVPGDMPTLDHDQYLSEVFARYRVVTGLIFDPSATSAPPEPKAGQAFVGSEPPHLMQKGIQAVRNLESLDNAALGIGNFNFAFEGQNDAVVRRVRLMQGMNGRWYPSLAVESLRVAQGAGAVIMKSSDGSGQADTGNLALVSMQVGALEVPVNEDGALTIYHSRSDAKPIMSASRVLFPQEHGLTAADLEAAFAGHIVLVGTSAPGLLDLRATTLQPVVPGVTIHADIIDQIISGNHINRADIARGVERFAAVIAVLLLLAFMPVLNPVGNSIVATSLAAAVVAGCWVAFSQYGQLFSPTVPLLSLLAAYGSGVAVKLLITERQSAFVRNAFAHYLSPTMVERLADSPDALTLGGEDRELTILFCDIRGFTSLSEGLAPTELTDLLNDFLTPMTDALLRRGATIDKYMGDAIMAFWNAPLDQLDHRNLAAQAVLDMRHELAALNMHAVRPISIGIGLNTGLCCVGNLGSQQRFSYSAIGDAVNVASRIEGLTKLYGVDNLVSQETLTQDGEMLVLMVDRVGVVGRREPLSVHTLIGPKASMEAEQVERAEQAHHRVMELYFAADLESALKALGPAREASTSLPDVNLDTLYNRLQERLETMQTEGVPENWDGVFRATSK